MSASNNKQITDLDISGGFVDQGRSGSEYHIFTERTTLEIAKKYYMRPEMKKGSDGKDYVRYVACKVLGDRLVDINLSIFINDHEFKGPSVPYVAMKTANGSSFDGGPTRPCVNFTLGKGVMNSIVDYITTATICAYIFNEMGFGKVYKNAITFVPAYLEGSFFEMTGSRDMKGNFLRVLTDTGDICSYADFLEKNTAPKDVKLRGKITDYTDACRDSANAVVYKLKCGFESKTVDEKYKDSLYLSADFPLAKGRKTRKIGGNTPTSAEDLIAMKQYSYWGFQINLAKRQEKKILTITGPGNAPMNWFTVGSPESRKNALWKALTKSIPEMENLPVPNVITNDKEDFYFKGGLRISVSSVGYGMGVAKAHFSIEEAYVLPEAVNKNKGKIEGDTFSIDIGNELQFGTSEGTEGLVGLVTDDE